MPQTDVPRDLAYADSHVHLDRYSDEDVAGMLARARAAGVGLLLTVGCEAASSRRAARLAATHEPVEAAAGLHPRWVRPHTLAEELAALRALLDSGQCPSAVGEIGLDGSADAPDFGVQLQAFAAQVVLARRFGLPVVVHADRAHREAAAVLKHGAETDVIIHYFNGTGEDLRRYLDLDCNISFGRLLLKPEHEALRALTTMVPAHRLLVETDTYPLPGRRTEPRDVVEVVTAVAAARGEPAEETAMLTTANLRRVLRLDD
jgi:TatD DNase family protein